jgi:hypothetical protein
MDRYIEITQEFLREVAVRYGRKGVLLYEVLEYGMNQNVLGGIALIKDLADSPLKSLFPPTLLVTEEELLEQEGRTTKGLGIIITDYCDLTGFDKEFATELLTGFTQLVLEREKIVKDITSNGNETLPESRSD